ncbi:MAG: hypothetical protein ACE5GF_00720 [Thermodesulfobacteriota bacterium]
MRFYTVSLAITTLLKPHAPSTVMSFSLTNRSTYDTFKTMIS